MLNRDKELFLRDIIESIDAIFDHIKGYELEDFKNDRKTYQAVVKEFEIIGEATKNVYELLKEKYPNYPWRLIIDFRNKLTNEDFGVDFVLIWNTIFLKLPELKQMIEKLIKEL
ncbi:HepT-like ribonuclease domain-containing protein [Caminibacter pacificus]